MANQPLYWRSRRNFPLDIHRNVLGRAQVQRWHFSMRVRGGTPAKAASRSNKHSTHTLSVSPQTPLPETPFGSPLDSNTTTTKSLTDQAPPKGTGARRLALYHLEKPIPA